MSLSNIRLIVIINYIFLNRFFDLLKNFFITDFEQFSVTLSSAWNISGILHVGPHIGKNFMSLISSLVY